MEPKAIAERAARLGFPAIALTDRNGLYAAMPFSDACIAKGVQPIIGAMLAVTRPVEIAGAPALDWLVLLAKDDAGYANLCKLVSSAHLDRPVSEDPHVDFAKLADHSEGLIALTAGSEGALGRLLADGQRLRRRGLSRPAPVALCRPPLHRNHSSSRRGRRSVRRGADRPGLCSRPAAGRDQPGRLFRSELSRRA